MTTRIAIDISQIAYGTGVSVYTENLVRTLVKKYPHVDWILFAGVFRQKKIIDDFARDLEVKYITKMFPPKIANIVWNRFHLYPIEKWIGKVDLIHTSDWTEPPSRLPKITTVHDLVPIIYPETTTKLIKKVHEQKLNWVKRESEKILAVSESTKQDLIKYLGISNNKIDVTYEGVEKCYYPRDFNEINKVKEKYNINGKYVFSLSTLEPRKNQTGLINAFNIISIKYPDLKLVLAGRIAWGKIPKFSKKIISLGYVPTNDLPALYTGALVYILPSFYEGFGLSQLQAMSCGTPVVTSNTSSMPEVVGNAGILVDPNNVDDIARGIVKAIDKRENLIHKGLKQIKKFSWERVAELTFKSYMDVIKTRS